ncbi:MAG TPA: type II toxin-antitoxin system VapC family toxin [Burkholderiaceae bacterium]|nr:type II toxin-antitoxin system VapC family toxin [Burkholderiaceae bacterium]
MTRWNVVDSSGWIEFFTAGANGPVFKPVIEQRHALLVPAIALFEVHRVLSRKLPPEVVTACLNVMRLGRVLDITAPRAVAGAEVALRHKLAMGDALMYSLALEHGATFWTQDVDYDNLPGVKYFAKPSPHAPQP